MGKSKAQKARKKRKRRRDPNKPRMVIVAKRSFPDVRVHLGEGVYINMARAAVMGPTLAAHPEWEDDPCWDGID